MNGNIDEANWREPRLYAGYLKNVQRFYEREPIIQISVQLILSVFTVAFFVFFAIRPTLGTVTTLLKKIEDLEELSMKLDEKIVQLGRAQEILATSGPVLESLTRKTLPATPELDRVSKAIEAVANETGVYLTALEFQTSTLGKRADQTSRQEFVTFSFDIGGTQEQIIDFLERLENMDRAVLLTKISVGEPELNYRQVFPLIAAGQATVYYLPEPGQE